MGLDIADCTFGKNGLTVTLRRSKTDQDGSGRKIGIPYGSNPETCPVRTVQAWIEQSGADTGHTCTAGVLSVVQNSSQRRAAHCYANAGR